MFPQLPPPLLDKHLGHKKKSQVLKPNRQVQRTILSSSDSSVGSGPEVVQLLPHQRNSLQNNLVLTFWCVPRPQEVDMVPPLLPPIIPAEREFFSIVYFAKKGARGQKEEGLHGGPKPSRMLFVGTPQRRWLAGPSSLGPKMNGIRGSGEVDALWSHPSWNSKRTE